MIIGKKFVEIDPMEIVTLGKLIVNTFLRVHSNSTHPTTKECLSLQEGYVELDPIECSCCNGTGKIGTNICPECNGSGIIYQ